MAVVRLMVWSMRGEKGWGCTGWGRRCSKEARILWPRCFLVQLRL